MIIEFDDNADFAALDLQTLKDLQDLGTEVCARAAAEQDRREHVALWCGEGL